MNEITTIKNLYPLLGRRRWGFLGIVLLGLLQSLSEGVGIGLLIPLLGGLVGGSQSQGKTQWLVNKIGSLFQNIPPDRRLTVIVACVFAAVVANALLSYLNTILFGWVNGNIGHNLRQRIFGQLLH